MEKRVEFYGVRFPASVIEESLRIHAELLPVQYQLWLDREGLRGDSFWSSQPTSPRHLRLELSHGSTSQTYDDASAFFNRYRENSHGSSDIHVGTSNPGWQGSTISVHDYHGVVSVRVTAIDEPFAEKIFEPFSKDAERQELERPPIPSGPIQVETYEERKSVAPKWTSVRKFVTWAGVGLGGVLFALLATYIAHLFGWNA